MPVIGSPLDVILTALGALWGAFIYFLGPLILIVLLFAWING